MAEVTIELLGMPKTLNHISNAGHWAKSSEIKQWRNSAHWAAKALRAKPLQTPVDIEVTQLCTPRKRPDHIGPALAVKGAVDGIVDAGVIPDDDCRYVRRLVFNAPVKSDRDALVITLREVDEA